MSSKLRLKSALKTITTSGKLQVDVLHGLIDEEKNLVQKLYDEGLAEESLLYLEALNTDKDWETLKKEMAKPEKTIVPFWKSSLKYAAVFIFLFAIACFFVMNQTDEVKLQITEDAITLKMGDDRIEVIDQTSNHQIVSSSGKVIGEKIGNKIKYHANSDVDKIVFNQLDIPNGKMFEVEFSDGTVVHINCGTKIRYPEFFLKGHKREVFIDGEAYFKVAKDKAHPFIVYADDFAVEVLGTEFNISSYKEDSEIKTVLIEGSVNMKNTIMPQDNIILKPGNKGSWHKTAHGTKIEKVDVEIYTSWMKGDLIFKGTTFENITKKLERKYNVKIENNNPALANKVLTAKFNSEIETIEDVLKSIGEIYPFDYEIDNKNILIYSYVEKKINTKNQR